MQVRIVRGVIQLVEPAEIQQAQATLLSEELADKLEIIQQAGFRSVPLPGTPCVAVYLNDDDGLIVGTETEGLAPDLNPGDVAIYDLLAGTTSLIVRASGTVEVNGPLVVNGPITSTGNISDVSGSMQEMRDTFNTHTHGSGAPPDQTMS